MKSWQTFLADFIRTAAEVRGAKLGGPREALRGGVLLSPLPFILHYRALQPRPRSLQSCSVVEGSKQAVPSLTNDVCAGRVVGTACQHLHLLQQPWVRACRRRCWFVYGVWLLWAFHAGTV